MSGVGSDGSDGGGGSGLLPRSPSSLLSRGAIGLLPAVTGVSSVVRGAMGVVAPDEDAVFAVAHLVFLVAGLGGGIGLLPGVREGFGGIGLFPLVPGRFGGGFFLGIATDSTRRR